MQFPNPQDAHEAPPESLRKQFKYWQKASIEEIGQSQDLIDFSLEDVESKHATSRECNEDFTSSDVFEEFCKGITYESCPEIPENVNKGQRLYEINGLPGLLIYPSLISPRVQIALLDKLLHRDLSNPVHKTNLHLHYDMPHSSSTVYFDPDQDIHCDTSSISMFSVDPTGKLIPKDHSIHKPIMIDQMLRRKLRWMTLGGQYDWTTKVYPTEKPPSFPEDIHHLLKVLFPGVDAQAAIVNFYTPGDTLSVHRDVSEDCDRDLISISIGCDAIFLVGNQDGQNSATVRIRSGDVILMGRPSRFAWHAVPKIIPGTCPQWLRGWPGGSTSGVYKQWTGWMDTKRINLNVRQMRS